MVPDIRGLGQSSLNGRLGCPFLKTCSTSFKLKKVLTPFSLTYLDPVGPVGTLCSKMSGLMVVKSHHFPSPGVGPCTAGHYIRWPSLKFPGIGKRPSPYQRFNSRTGNLLQNCQVFTSKVKHAFLAMGRPQRQFLHCLQDLGLADALWYQGPKAVLIWLPRVTFGFQKDKVITSTTGNTTFQNS